MAVAKTKAVKMRKYKVAWVEPVCGFIRALTLRAKNIKEATKLVASEYPAKGKHKVTWLKSS